MPAHWLNRRGFLTGLGCASLLAGAQERPPQSVALRVRRAVHHSGSGIICPAIASPCMPELLVVGESMGGILMRGEEDFQERFARAGYIELRRYHGATTASVRMTLAKCGVTPLLTGMDGSCLFAFETLGHREKAWRELSAERRWQELRTQLKDLAIYKVPQYSI